MRDFTTLDLGDAATPRDVPDILSRVVDAYRIDAADLAATWQDNHAGRVWSRIAARLETARLAIEKVVREWEDHT